MNDGYIDIQAAADKLEVSERHLRRLCVMGRIPGARKHGSTWQVPRTADARLAGGDGRTADAGSLDIATLPVPVREEAMRRRGIIEQCEKFCGIYVAQGGDRSTAIEMFCSQQTASVRSLRRWMQRYRLEGIAGLIDRRHFAEGGEATISQEAWDEFCGMYLTQQQLSVKLCRQNLLYINKTESHGWRIPSLRRMQELVAQRIPRPTLVLLREGQEAYDAKCAPYILGDPDSVEPGEIWIGDHHQFNCFVRDRGRWVRPWVTAWEDKRSRAIVGWHISTSPNQTTIMLSFKRAAEKYGLPAGVKIDNGKDYDSQMFTGLTKQQRRRLATEGTERKRRDAYCDEAAVTGLYAMMGVAVSFAIPYHPQSKAIERLFDTVDIQFTKTMATYCGKDTDRKPEGLAAVLEKGEGMSLEEFAAMFGQWAQAYDAQGHTGAGMNGRSPDEVMATRTVRRQVDERVLDLLLRDWTGELTVGKNGVTVKNLAYGQYDAELMKWQGKKVRCSYDPADMRAVYVYDAASWRLICKAQQARLLGYGAKASEDDLREAMRQKAVARRTAKDYSRTRTAAAMSLPELTIAAMHERSRQSSVVSRQEEGRANIVAVRTPLDGQAAAHLRIERQAAVDNVFRKAAGAEGLTDADLTIDTSSLLAGRKRASIDLFEGSER